MTKKTKLFSVLLAAVLAGGCFACGNGGKKTEGGAVLWTAPMTVKYMLEDTPDLKYGDTLTVELGRNETESVQLIVTPDTNVSSYDLQVGALTGGGNEIPAENVSVYREHYIKVTQATGNFPLGYYPDAMVPLALSKQAGEDKIKKGQNQAFVIQVRTDADTPAGEYEADVTLTLDGTTYTRKLRVTVWDYALPKETHAKTAFALWDDQLTYGYYTAGEDMIDEYYEFMLDYRISLLNVPNTDGLTTEEKVDKVFEYACRAEVSGINLPYLTVDARVTEGENAGMLYTTFDKADMEKLLRGLINKEKETGKRVFHKFYVYMGALDEPQGKKLLWVQEANNDFAQLKQTLAADELLFSSAAYEDIRQELLEVEFVITTPIQDALIMDRPAGDYRGVDTWCPQFDNFNSEAQRRTAAERVAAGDKMWWYGCIGPKNPYPTYHTDDNLLSARLINWMMMDYGIDANLYWSINIFGKYNAERRTYFSRDCWTDGMAFPGANGDGYLVYPGRKYGLTGPIPTVRLEAIRDGQEDYESLLLLKTLTARIAAEAGISYDFNASLANLYRLLYQGTVPTEQEQLLAFARRAVAQQILAAQDGVLTVYERNDKTNKITARIYAPSDVTDVTAGGSALTGTPRGDYRVYTAALFPDAGESTFAVGYKTAGAAKRYSVYTGGAADIVKDFDAELTGVTVSDADEYDGTEDMRISLDKAHAVSGQALKADMAGVEGNRNYRPTLTVEGLPADLSGYSSLRFYLFNAGAAATEVAVRLGSAELDNVIVDAGTGRTVELSLDFAVTDVSAARKLQFVFPHLNSGETAAVFLDNIAFVNRGYAALAPKLREVAVGTDDFGLYNGSGSTEYNFKKGDGVLFDFEEDESMIYNILYRYVHPSLSLVTDEQYVTSLDHALSILVKGQPASGPNYCPAIVFMFEDANYDMRNVDYIALDGYVISDKPEVQLGFNVVTTAGIRTANRLKTIRTGERVTFTWSITGMQDEIRRSSGWDKNVYLTEEEKSIREAEIWMNNLTAADKPFTIVVDNLRLVYKQ